MSKQTLILLMLSLCATGCISRSDYRSMGNSDDSASGGIAGVLILFSEFGHYLGWAGDGLAKSGVHVQSRPLPNELTMTVFEYQQMDTAARKGDPVAQHAVGLCYAKGKAVVKDEAIAVDWYRRSAGQGYGPAFVNLSDCYAQGAGVTKDQVEAYAYARLASQVGAAGPQRLVEMEGRLTPLEVVAGSQRALSLWSELMLKAKSPPIDEAKR